MGSTPLEYCWFIYKIGGRTGRLTGQFETYAQLNRQVAKFAERPRAPTWALTIGIAGSLLRDKGGPDDCKQGSPTVSDRLLKRCHGRVRKKKEWFCENPKGREVCLSTNLVTG